MNPMVLQVENYEAVIIRLNFSASNKLLTLSKVRRYPTVLLFIMFACVFIH